ncbi:MAG TPA: response regulator [Gammaproteobacteria bacterium]
MTKPIPPPCTDAGSERPGATLHAPRPQLTSGPDRPRGRPDGPAVERSAASVSRKLPVAIVDDDPAVLRSLSRLLDLHGFDAKPFLSPQSLLGEIESLAPACLIADLAMPGLTGLDLQRRFDECGFGCPIVFVTAHGDIRTSVQAMRGGAVDFLTKPFDRRELLDAVERAIERGERLREAVQRRNALRERLATLTEREREVFDQVAAGYLNKQIAANLGISEKTVKVHRARVMRKMSVRSLAQLARVAEQIGIDPRGVAQ